MLCGPVPPSNYGAYYIPSNTGSHLTNGNSNIGTSYTGTYYKSSHSRSGDSCSYYERSLFSSE